MATRWRNLARRPTLAVAALLGVCSTAAAQTDTVPSASRQLPPLELIEPGTPVRLATDGRWLSGVVHRVAADTLFLNDHAIDGAAIHRLQVRQRATGYGIKRGTLIGIPTGAVSLGLIGTWASGACEQDCEGTGVYAARAALLGAGLGMLAGATAGAIIGASTTRWTDATARNLRGAAHTRVTGTVVRQRTGGSVSAAPAYTFPSDNDGNGAGGRVTLMMHRTHVAVGPELGYYSVGSRPRVYPDTGEPYTLTARETLWYGAGVVRLGAGQHRRVEPYATGGVGWYWWGTDVGDGQKTAGYSLGGGAQLRSARGWHGLFIEGRWQSRLTAATDSHSYGFGTLSAGATLAW
jgi:F0F1-type ATP synthase membrane subunit c/vacuolar-type H+-ATPase subunit K